MRHSARLQLMFRSSRRWTRRDGCVLVVITVGPPSPLQQNSDLQPLYVEQALERGSNSSGFHW